MTVILSEVRSEWSADAQQSSKVIYRVDLGERSYEVFLRSNYLLPQPGLEALVPLALLAAMRLRRPLHVCGRLSVSFLRGVEQVMALYERSFDGFFAVPIKVDEVYEVEVSPLGNRRAAFFSGGVDSFYTLMKGRSELTDLIFIYGFDVRLDDWGRRQAISEMGHAVASEMGMRFIEVESNLAKVIEDFGSWPVHGHGFALVSVARALAGDIVEVRIPGTHSLQGQKPWGSWVESDPLFSDQRLRIYHDACEAERADKLLSLAREPLALRYLRVCWGRVDGMYNCCRCEKCLRTMTSLYVFGALERATAFPLSLQAEQVAAVLLPRPGLRIYPEENLQLLQRYRPDDFAMQRALRKQLKRPIWWSVLRLKWRKRISRWRGQFARLLGTARK